MESGLDRETAARSLEESKQVLSLLAEKQKISASSTERKSPGISGLRTYSCTR